MSGQPYFCVICRSAVPPVLVIGTPAVVHLHIVMAHGKGDDYAGNVADRATWYMARVGRRFYKKHMQKPEDEYDPSLEQDYV